MLHVFRKEQTIVFVAYELLGRLDVRFFILLETATTLLSSEHSCTLQITRNY